MADINEQLNFLNGNKSPTIQSLTKSKKNWNIFRSPEQKDLFGFLQHQQTQNILFDIDKVQFKTQSQIKPDSIIQEQNQEQSWRSQLTFASHKNNNQDNQHNTLFGTLKNKNKKQESFGTMKSQTQLKSILKNNNKHKKSLLINLQVQDPQKKQQPKKLINNKKLNDSLSNIFMKQASRVRQKQQLTGTRLFNNFYDFNQMPPYNTISQESFMKNSIDKDKNSQQFMFLRTLNDLKTIDKENLQVNKMIYELLKNNLSKRKDKKDEQNSKTKRSTKGKSVASMLKSESKSKNQQKVSTSIQNQHNVSQQSNKTYKSKNTNNPFFIPSQNLKSKSKLFTNYHQKSSNHTFHQISNTFNKTSTTTTKKLSLRQKQQSKQNQNNNHQLSHTSTAKRLKNIDPSIINKLESKINEKLNQIDRIKSSVNGLILKKHTLSLKLNNNQQALQNINTSKKKNTINNFLHK